MDNKKIETEVNEEVQVLKGRGATNVKEKHWEYKMILVIDPNFCKTIGTNTHVLKKLHNFNIY